MASGRTVSPWWWAAGTGTTTEREGKRVSSPRPRTFRFSVMVGLSARLASHLGLRGRFRAPLLRPRADFLGQLEISLRASGTRIVEDRGLAVTWRLGQSNVAGNGGLAQQLPEETAQI